MFRLSFALALLGTGFLPAGHAAAPAGIVPPNAPKSTFVYETGFGKDPFFPKSTRRVHVVAVEPSNTQSAVLDYISLKGISNHQGRKLCMINNYTVAEGEEISLRSGNQAIKLKCVEIKDRMVIVQVNGVIKELPLRAGFN